MKKIVVLVLMILFIIPTLSYADIAKEDPYDKVTDERVWEKGYFSPSKDEMTKISKLYKNGFSLGETYSIVVPDYYKSLSDDDKRRLEATNYDKDFKGTSIEFYKFDKKTNNLVRVSAVPKGIANIIYQSRVTKYRYGMKYYSWTDLDGDAPKEGMLVVSHIENRDGTFESMCSKGTETTDYIKASKVVEPGESGTYYSHGDHWFRAIDLLGEPYDVHLRSTSVNYEYVSTPH
jgi:hypothetical protein